MDFIRNLFTLLQRLQDIVRDGQRQGDIPGMAMGLMRELRGGAAEDQAEGDGPAVYRGKVAQADKATPEAASRDGRFGGGSSATGRPRRAAMNACANEIADGNLRRGSFAIATASTAHACPHGAPRATRLLTLTHNGPWSAGAAITRAGADADG